MTSKTILYALLLAGVLLGAAPGAFADDNDNGPPACAEGETLVYKGGVPVCGPACPAYAYGSLGNMGGAAFNIPASEIGDIHPAAGSVGLPTGGARNAALCTFHVQCTAAGWVAITTGADACQAVIQDVP